MAKKYTPSFIFTLPLLPTNQETKLILRRLNASTHIYNELLREALKIQKRFSQDKQLQKTLKSLRQQKKDAKTKEDKHLISKKISNINYFSEFTLITFGKKFTAPFKNVGAQIVQKLAKRAFNAVFQYHIKKRGKPRFKKVRSIENAEESCNLHFKDGFLVWGDLRSKKSLKIRCQLSDSVYTQHALKHRIKFLRLVKKTIRGKNKFFLQLILEGKPLSKHPVGNDVVGIDLGPSTIAIVSSTQAKLQELCPAIRDKSREIRILQRKADRQRRASNPGNYNENGTIKKGKKSWNYSHNYKQNKNKLREIHRKLAEHRKSQHGQLANSILKMGNVFKLEDISYRGWQKRFGRSVNRKAPAMLVGMIQRKASSAGAEFQPISTRETYLSQRCICGEREKKSLSQRWHNCKCGVYAQRDLFSAYLARYVGVENEFDTDQSLADWCNGAAILHQAVSELRKVVSSGNCFPRNFGLGQRRSDLPGKLDVNAAILEKSGLVSHITCKHKLTN